MIKMTIVICFMNSENTLFFIFNWEFHDFFSPEENGASCVHLGQARWWVQGLSLPGFPGHFLAPLLEVGTPNRRSAFLHWQGLLGKQASFCSSGECLGQLLGCWLALFTGA
jgi:hypothetical protein